MRLPHILDILATAVDVLVAVLVAAALTIAWTGGGRAELAGFDVSARDWTRPALAAVILILLTQIPLLLRRRRRLADSGIWLSGIAFAGLAIAGIAVTATGIVHACGGLDSHGYVAASRLFSEGRLHRPLPDLTWLPLERAVDAAVPLGFVPAADGRTLAPRSMPGLPLVMAVVRSMGGADAVFWVSWTAFIALAVALFLLARRRYGALTARLAGVMVIAHPVAAAYGMQAMSDVPAAMWTALAVWGMTGAARQKPVLAGLAGSMAVLTRPPLILPMAVLGAAVLRGKPRAAMTFGGFVLPGLAGLMWLQQELYGSPFGSGYGGAGDLFGLASVWHNLSAHGKWILIVHTPLLVPLLWVGFRSDRWFGGVMFAMCAAVAAPYLFFAVRFDDWEMLRYLLPGLVLLLPVAAEGLAVLLRRIPSAVAQHALAAGVAVLLLVSSARWLESKGVFRLPLQEAKYPRVAAWFTERTPANAIVFASLHSGSVNYYSGRMTLRWDVIPAEALPATLAAARARGYPVYLVLDGTDEVARFNQRFLTDSDPGVEIRPVDRILTVQIAEIGTAADAHP